MFGSHDNAVKIVHLTFALVLNEYFLLVVKELGDIAA